MNPSSTLVMFEVHTARTQTVPPEEAEGWMQRARSLVANHPHWFDVRFERLGVDADGDGDVYRATFVQLAGCLASEADEIEVLLQQQSTEQYGEQGNVRRVDDNMLATTIPKDTLRYQWVGKGNPPIVEGERVEWGKRPAPLRTGRGR